MSREEELTARIAELEEAVRSRDDFLAIAAHELRNPMYALGLHLDLAIRSAKALGNEGLVGALYGAKMSLDRYVERATTLLDVSRINAGRMDIRLTRVDAAAVVRQVAAGYEGEAVFTGATLRCHLPESLHIHCDRLALEQIAGNLISNGIKYGAEGPVDVTLARDGAQACLTVRDRGPGITPEEQERIFGQFNQVVAAERRAGFGIGLWLARLLIEGHGGSIAVESAPGAGSTFTVRLPLNAIPVARQDR